MNLRERVDAEPHHFSTGGAARLAGKGGCFRIQRVHSQCIGQRRGCSDSRHRAVEMQAANLHPPSLFSFMLTGIPV